jgi:GNAT superfamily N-acetyltransferase
MLSRSKGGQTLGTLGHIHIEEAVEADIPLILAFIQELAQYERALDRVTATEEGLRVTLFGPRPYAEAVIARENQKPVGFALYYFSYTSFSAQPGLYLEDIFVRPPARGLGIGFQLIKFLAQKAIETNCARMEWSVLNWNEHAIRFYEKVSAEPVLDWTVFHLSAEKMARLIRVAAD